jgi:protein tyrosine phosphatase (PTP) superfamily phosphohydrolase (DUF442 family)
MYLQELAGQEVQRLPVITLEHQVAHAGRQHAAADKAQGKVFGHGGSGAVRSGRLY